MKSSPMLEMLKFTNDIVMLHWEFSQDSATIISFRASMKVTVEIISIEYGNAFDFEDMFFRQTRQGHF